MGFFDRIGHARFKFALIVLGDKRVSDNPAFNAAFFLRTQADMADRGRYFEMTGKDIATINPNTRTAPVFRTRADAELTEQIYAHVPVLIDDAKGKDGNPWGIDFARLFDMSTDSGVFRTARQCAADRWIRDGRDWVTPNPGERYVALYEAKMIHHYNHRWATYEDGTGEDIARDTTNSERANPAFEAEPRYWVPESDVSSRLATKGWTRGWLMGWRDITNATNERTTIASIFPRSGCGDTLLLKFPQVQDLRLAAALNATLISLVQDFVARQKVGGTHMKYNVFKQLAVLPPFAFSEASLAFIAQRVLKLTYSSYSMKPFADDLGYRDNSPFPWDDDRRALLRAELDAKIACLYGLTRDQLRYILDPADIYGPTYPSETFRGLKKNEIAKYGEYRTARLVLDAWDRIERGQL